jgi:hypothetical protein
MNITLLDSKQLPDFPSGSGIEYYDDRVYLVGDDSPSVLVMNKKWKSIKKINLFDSDTDRIPKRIKSDIEATAIVQVNKSARLLMLGSGSRDQFRNKAILLNLTSLETEEFDLQIFYTRLKQAGLTELNIEGAAMVEEQIILCSRGHKANPSNCLIITSKDFWKNQDDAEILILKMELEQPEHFMGVSGLTYSVKNDWLLFTMSTEDTNHAYADGRIGDSYLGIIENVSRKIGRKKMKVNSLINLSEVNEKFKGNKIESVCIQRDKENNLKLHLVADNDIGDSFLFKIKLTAE